MQTKLKELQEKINYSFHNEEILVSALMHSSYTNEIHLPKYKCNERLEFLGDAVLEIISSEFLYYADHKKSEGELTRLRASMVCEFALAFCAREIGLGEYLFLGKGEDGTGGRDRDSIISDALEALIGAIYLDGGFANAKEFVHNFVLNDLENKKLFYDSKTILQEMIQSQYGCELSYKLVGQEGPDHCKTFFVEAFVGDVSFGSGKGRTKKAAEQEAAYNAILALRGIDKK